MYGEKIRWTQGELETVAKMHRAGDSVTNIAFTLARSEDSVRSVIKKINMLKKNGYKASTKSFKTLLAKGENQLRAQLRGY